MPVEYCLFETPIGVCGIAWSAADKRTPPAITALQLPEATRQQTAARIARKSGGQLARAVPRQIAAVTKRIVKHLSGAAQDFADVALDLGQAGEFEQRVYAAARQIRSGRTRTYGELASDLGSPGAARAVGQALGNNPITIIIPCHRVLAAGGKPGGFSAHGGRDTKARMLDIEGATVGPPLTIKSARDLAKAAAILKQRDPRLAAHLELPIEWRLKPERSAYSALFEAIIHQQLATAAARTIFGRVVGLYRHGSIPEPAELLRTPDDKLRGAGLSRSKATSLKDLAAKTLDGTVPSADEIISLSNHEIIERLTAIYGIGQWTVEMMLIFNLGRMDVFPVDDYAIRKSAASVFGFDEVPSSKVLVEQAELWRPHRTVASLYLWNWLNAAAKAAKLAKAAKDSEQAKAGVGKKIRSAGRGASPDGRKPKAKAPSTRARKSRK